MKSITSLSGGGHLGSNSLFSGFTLAEVLITLGVIGLVAALTMPSLIAHYQKKVLVTQIKKAYSTLNEGFRQSY